MTESWETLCLREREGQVEQVPDPYIGDEILVIEMENPYYISKWNVRNIF